MDERDLLEAPGELSDEAVGQALGSELRRAREARGWSQEELATILGLGQRTVAYYESGDRKLTVFRLIQFGRVLGSDGPTLLIRALQRARVDINNLTLRVDLRELLSDCGEYFAAVGRWAQKAMSECPSGIAEVEPAVVRTLAMVVGCTHQHLANYLAQFISEDPPPEDGAEQ